MKNPLILLATALVCAGPSLADGSVDWSDVEPLLTDHPAVRALLISSLEISSTGMAARFGNHQPHLGGGRIGPYRFQVHRKSARREPLLLTICTVPAFFDTRGRPTTWELAASFKERLAFVALTEGGEPGPACNEWVADEPPLPGASGTVNAVPPNPSLQRTTHGHSPCVAAELIHR